MILTRKHGLTCEFDKVLPDLVTFLGSFLVITIQCNYTVLGFTKCGTKALAWLHHFRTGHRQIDAVRNKSSCLLVGSIDSVAMRQTYEKHTTKEPNGLVGCPGWNDQCPAPASLACYMGQFGKLVWP